MSLKEDISKKYKKMRWLKKKYGLEYPTVWKDELKKAREEKDYKKISEVLDDMIMDLEIQKEEKMERKREKKPKRKRKKKSIFQRFVPEAKLKRLLNFDFGGRDYQEKKTIDGEDVISGFSLEEIEKKFKGDKELLKDHIMTYIELHREPEDLKEDFKDVKEFILESDIPDEKKETIKELYGG